MSADSVIHGRPITVSLDHYYFQNIDTEEKAYWLGFIAADGCVHQNLGKWYFSIQLSSVDYEHLVKLKTALGFSGKTSRASSSNKITGKIYSGVRFSARSSALVGCLLDCGITPRKSLTLEPWDGPPELMRHYWRGLIDGDGFIWKNQLHRDWAIGFCGSEAMVREFREYLAGVGVKGGSLSKYSEGHYRIRYCGTLITKTIVSLMYENCTVYLERKMSKALELMSLEVKEAYYERRRPS